MNRRRMLVLSGGFAVAAAVPRQAALAKDADAATASFDALLKRYVLPNSDGVNRVDYGRWKASGADRAALSAFIDALAGMRPSTMQRNAAFAYWANLYNAITLKVILDRYPVASIREIKSDGLFDPKAYLGPWRTKRVTVEGKSLSLDDIEHETMRPTFKDPLVHYSVNCASIGCPNLLTSAWRPETLEADLDAAARAFVNHRRGVEVLAGNRLRVSSIYKWFRDDFGKDDAGVIAHFKRYAAPELAAKLASATAIAEDQYDWALNDGKASA